MLRESCIESSVIGTVAGLIKQVHKADAKHQDQLDRITSTLRTSHVDHELQQRIMAFYHSAWGVEQSHRASQLLAGLPEKLALMLQYQMHETLLRNVPLFAYVGPEMILVLLLKMVEIVAFKGNRIIQAGETVR